MAQSPTPPPLATNTPREATEAATTPAPDTTPEVAASEPLIGTGVLLDVLENQPDLIEAILDATMTRVEAAYQHGQVWGIAAFVVVVIVFSVMAAVLYKNAQGAQQASVGVQLARGGSAILGAADRIDFIRNTDIDNKLLQAGKSWLDERIEKAEAETAKLRAELEKRGYLRDATGGIG